MMTEFKWDSKNITAVYKTANSFYLGVENKGLMSIKNNSEPTYVFTDNVTIFNIIPNNNDLWLATNNGLVTFNILNKQSHVYREEDGINNKVLYSNSSFIHDEWLVFGGQNGLIKFNPDDYDDQTFNFKIVKPVKVSTKHKSTKTVRVSV